MVGSLCIYYVWKEGFVMSMVNGSNLRGWCSSFSWYKMISARIAGSQPTVVRLNKPRNFDFKNSGVLGTCFEGSICRTPFLVFSDPGEKRYAREFPASQFSSTQKVGLFLKIVGNFQETSRSSTLRQYFVIFWLFPTSNDICRNFYIGRRSSDVHGSLYWSGHWFESSGSG